MPLHDWTDDRSWDSVHQLWINALLFWAQERLPAGYRAYLGSVPGLSIGTEAGRSDLGARTWQPRGAETMAPSESLVELASAGLLRFATLLRPEPRAAVHVFRQGQLVAAVELVSPRNKDRPSSREFYRNRYLSYLWSGVHLMLIDVHRRPLGFSFVEAMAAEVECQLPVGPPPHVVSWNAGGSTPEGGQFLDGWYRSLAVGEPLPTLPLALTAERSLLVDLESTYSEAAAVNIWNDQRANGRFNSGGVQGFRAEVFGQRVGFPRGSAGECCRVLSTEFQDYLARTSRAPPSDLSLRLPPWSIDRAR